MAVVKKCDVCGKYYEASRDAHYKYTEEDDQNVPHDYIVNSFRLGNWDPKNKCWRSIVSAYDVCKDCGREITEAIFHTNKGDNNLVSRIKVPYKPRTAEQAPAQNNEEAADDAT